MGRQRIGDPARRVWWLWLPLLVLAAQVVMELTVPAARRAVLLSESGPHETAQFILLLAAFIVAVRGLWGMPVRRFPGYAAWLALAALCCFYVGGEEISWGQHILQWDTPEYWAALNDQNETNFHNTSSWFDQKPRLLLEIGVMAGGLLLPWVLRARPAWVPAPFAPLCPPPWLAVTAGIVLGLKVVNAAVRAMDLHFFERVSEVIELYLYYFVLLYLVQLRHRFSDITSKNYL